MKTNILLNKIVAVMGLGVSGMATARFLRNCGAYVLAWDDDYEKCRAAQRENFIIKDFRHCDWTGIEFLVWSPGIPHTYPTHHPVADLARSHEVPFICDIELFLKYKRKGKVIGITGSNGKSTVTALVAHILEAAGKTVRVGGNFGTAVFDLEPMDDGAGFYVLELSSYQLELIPSLDLDVAVLTNISKIYEMTYHNGMKGYVAAKENIFQGHQKKVKIIATDDSYTRKIYKEISSKRGADISPVSLKKIPHGVYVEKSELIDDLDKKHVAVMDLNDVKTLPGKHNWQNILIAYMVARSLKIPSAKIVKGILSFRSLPHRLEFFLEKDGVKYVNDSKGTNADSVEKALTCYDEIYWIAGGQVRDKEGIDSLKPYFKKIRCAFLIGEATRPFAKTLFWKAKHKKCFHLEKAVTQAVAMARKDFAKKRVKNPVVLLSPACPSWDQFTGFPERGDMFKQLVKDMVG